MDSHLIIGMHIEHQRAMAHKSCGHQARVLSEVGTEYVQPMTVYRKCNMIFYSNIAFPSLVEVFRSRAINHVAYWLCEIAKCWSRTHSCISPSYYIILLKTNIMMSVNKLYIVWLYYCVLISLHKHIVLFVYCDLLMLLPYYIVIVWYYYTIILLYHHIIILLY